MGYILGVLADTRDWNGRGYEYPGRVWPICAARASGKGASGYSGYRLTYPDYRA
jgi:hypothetical protein